MNINALLALAITIGVTGRATAQESTLRDGPKPAIKTANDKPPAMPVPGKTSFTADQAAERMTRRGYNLVSFPLKDNQGIWYAEGQKPSGETVQIMMDYQGNVFEGQGSDAEGADHRTQPAVGPASAPTNTGTVNPVSPKQR